jgi:hypothetical protein
MLVEYDIQLEWVKRFLFIARIGKMYQINHALKEKIKTLQAKISELAANKDRKEEDYQKKKAELEKNIQEERKSAKNLEERKEELCHLLSPDFPVDIHGKPLLIVAGCCDSRYESLIICYKYLFATAFNGFSGTIISGPAVQPQESAGMPEIFPARRIGRSERYRICPRTSPSGLTFMKRIKPIRRTVPGFRPWNRFMDGSISCHQT